MNRYAFTVCAWLLLFAAATAHGGEGIASRYPGDAGIEKDPAVVFSDFFEEPSREALGAKWSQVRHPERVTHVEDVPPGSPGKYSVHLAGGDGAHLWNTLSSGYEQLYMRFYTKVSTNGKGISHFIGMGGMYPPSQSARGGAGHRWDGDWRFGTSFEPSGWNWINYSYWCRMHPFPNGRYWGNVFYPEKPAPFIRGKWMCVEFMVKMNDPVTECNGEQASWVDGEKIMHQGPGFPKGYWEWGKFINDPDGEPFEGFRWRTSKQLQLNHINLQLWQHADSGVECWFDHMVLATEYVGPIQE